MPKFVSVVCACGSKFDREVKQGRPQVWCPTCREKPFYERTGAKSTAVAVVEPVAVAEVETEEATDPMSSWRERVEAAVAERYAAHKVRYEALVAEGLSKWEAANLCADMISAPAMREVYKTAGTKPKSKAKGEADDE